MLRPEELRSIYAVRSAAMGWGKNKSEPAGLLRWSRFDEDGVAIDTSDLGWFLDSTVAELGRVLRVWMHIPNGPVFEEDQHHGIAWLILIGEFLVGRTTPGDVDLDPVHQ